MTEEEDKRFEEHYPGKPPSGLRGGEPGAEGEEDRDVLPGLPGHSHTPWGDTDQHSRVPSQ